MLNDVFAAHVGRPRRCAAGRREYWTDVIGAVRAAHPDFLFVAEAYWDMEWDLQQLGFDHCYDKRLYDRLLHDGAGVGARPPRRRPGLPAAGWCASSRTTTSRGPPAEMSRGAGAWPPRC